MRKVWRKLHGASAKSSEKTSKQVDTQRADHEDSYFPSRLCTKCANLNFESPAGARIGYTHHTLAGLEQSAEQGCHLCTMLLHDLCKRYERKESGLLDRNEKRQWDAEWLDVHRSDTEAIELHITDKIGEAPSRDLDMYGRSGDRTALLTPITLDGASFFFVISKSSIMLIHYREIHSSLVSGYFGSLYGVQD